MASLAARLIETAGIDHLLAVDLHAPQIEGFFHIPVDDIDPLATLLDAVRPDLTPGVVVVSPDLGRLAFATRIADELHTDVAVVQKRRISGAESHPLQLVGDVRDRPCLVVDDMITTGGTIAGCVEALERAGARPGVTVAATHGLFVAGAGTRLQLEGIGRIVVTDTLPQPELGGRRTVVSVAPLLAAAVRRLRA
jgi:ribose-phosphate pyrophosphokinase